MNTLIVAGGIALFIVLLALVIVLKTKFKLGFTARVIAALILGFAYGALLQVFLKQNAEAQEITKWVSLIGKAFTRLLQFVVVPLVIVSLISAFALTSNAKDSAKKSGLVIGVLLLTTLFSAAVAINVTKLFNLPFSQLGTPTGTPQKTDLSQTLLEFIPSNLFAALSSGNILPVVLIAALIGFLYLSINKTNPKLGGQFISGLEKVKTFVMEAVYFVIELTPYGILSIIIYRAASGSIELTVQLFLFILASFAAMAIVFVFHLVMLFFMGKKPINYLKNTGAALLFAFSSRSSAATLPLTIKAQQNLGVSETNANLAGTLGTCMGQNACAGIYPTMVAILAGQIQGLNVWSPAFLIPLVIYVLIASIGTAGVGGGALNVSLVVLSFMGLPLELATLLVSVDFIIDMGRTAVNVNGSIFAGCAVSWLEGKKNNIELSPIPQVQTADFVKTQEEETQDAKTSVESLGAGCGLRNK